MMDELRELLKRLEARIDFQLKVRRLDKSIFSRIRSMNQDNTILRRLDAGVNPELFERVRRSNKGTKEAQSEKP